MAEPDALLIDALTRLTQQGGYEAAGEQMYPGLYPTDPSLAPMPSFDGGRRSMGGQYERGSLYGAGGPLGGAGLLGGPIKPHGDSQRGELDVAAAGGGWIPPTPAEDLARFRSTSYTSTGATSSSVGQRRAEAN